MTLPGEMSLPAISSPQSHLSTASSVNTANTHGNEWGGTSLPVTQTVTFISCSHSGQLPYTFLLCVWIWGRNSSILRLCCPQSMGPQCSEDCLSRSANKRRYHKNQVWGWSLLQDCSLQLNRKAIWLPKWMEQHSYRPASTVWHESQV